MSEKEAFISSILATPDDETARLVFADWLDEHGEAERAAFIRAQFNIERTVPGSDKHREWMDQESRLRLAHEKEWTPAWPEDAEVARVEFRHGFVDTVELPWRSYATHAQALSALAPIRHVRLSRGEQPEVAAQVLENMPPTVRALSFTGSLIMYGLGNQNYNIMSFYTRLGRLQQLQTLNINSHSIMNEAPLKEIGGLKNLRRLSLTGAMYDGMGLTAHGAAQMHEIGNMQQLEYLELRNNRLRGLGSMQEIVRLKNLRGLNLYNNYFAHPQSDDPQGQVRALAQADMPLLEELDIRKNHIKMERFRAELGKAYQRTIETNGEAGSMVSLHTLNGQPLLPASLAELRDEAAKAYWAVHSPAGEVVVENMATTLKEREHA